MSTVLTTLGVVAIIVLSKISLLQVNTMGNILTALIIYIQV